MRAAVLGVLVIGSSCAPIADEVIPPLPPGGAKTLLLMRVPDPLDPTSVDGLVMDPEGGLFGWDVNAAPFDLALWFAEDAATLGMPTAKILAHDAKEGGRLPLSTAVYQRASGGEWTLATDHIPALRGFRFPYRNDAPCLGMDVCFADDSTTEEGSFCRPECLPKPEIAPPAPPERPRLNGCPEGWEVHTSTAISALPPIESCSGVRSACGPAERAVIGRGCVAIGRACNGTRWPDPPAGSVLWVANDARAGTGLGTQTAPLLLAEALARASAGDVLALSAGEHRVNGSIDRPVTLYGACTATTTIVDDDAAIDGELTIDGATLKATTVRVGGALHLRGAMIRAAVGTSSITGIVTAEDAIFDTSADVRWHVSGEIEATDVELRTASFDLRGAGARASVSRAVITGSAPLFRVTEGGSIELDTTWVEAARGADVIELAGGTVDLARTRVQGGTIGIHALFGGGDIRLREVWSTNATSFIFGSGSATALFTVDASDWVVTGGANAVAFYDTAAVRLERVAFEGLSDVAIALNTSMTSVFEKSSIEVVDVTATNTGGLIAAITGKVSLMRARVDATIYRVINVESNPARATTKVTVSDLDVSNALSAIVRLQGNGFYTVHDEVQPTLDAVFERVRVRGARGHAILCGKGRSNQRFSDLSISGVKPFDPALSPDNLGCDMYRLFCVGSGVIARPGLAGQLAVDLERFQISNVAATGIDVQLLAAVRARRGDVSADQVGLYYGDAATPWRDRFTDVAWHAPLPVVLHPE